MINKTILPRQIINRAHVLRCAR